MFIPYRADAPVRRWPIANFLILGIFVLCYALRRAQLPEYAQTLAQFELTKDTPLGLIGYAFFHDNVYHLVGNMLFLWIFGNAICARVGNLAYLFVFLALGAVAGLTHLSLNDAPAIGASGAINGIVAMFLVWYPTNTIAFFYVSFFSIGARRKRRGYWMILLWLAFDIFGAVLGWGGLTYWAHVGGFAAGFGLAILLLELGRVRMDPHERSLLHILGVEKDPDDHLGPVIPSRPVAPAAAGASVTPPSAAAATSLAPPEGYFVSFACPCGAELRAARKRAGEEITCPKCLARTKIPGP